MERKGEAIDAPLLLVRTVGLTKVYFTLTFSRSITMSTLSKKRKRAAEDESSQVKIKVVEASKSSAGPVLGE
jgi:hypothetical protein